MPGIKKLKSCPVCGVSQAKHYTAGLKNFRAHIRHMARSELFNREILGQKQTPHLDYVKKNLKIIEGNTIVIREE